MGRILTGEIKEEFEKEFNVEADSIIILIDTKKKIASYILDATKRIEDDYEKILKYYNQKI